MTPKLLTMLWAGVMAAHVLCFVIAWVRTLGRPAERLPVTVAAIPAMFGTFVFALFLQVWVVGDQGASWTPDPVQWHRLWYRWWWVMIAGSPVVLGLGLWSLRLQPRGIWSLGARVTGILSTVVAVFVLAGLPAVG